MFRLDSGNTGFLWVCERYLVHMHRHRNQMDRCSARGQSHRNPRSHRHSSDYNHRHRNLTGTLKTREEKTVDDMLTRANACYHVLRSTDAGDHLGCS